MTLLKQITGLLKDPPPAYAFELSESGVAFAKLGRTAPEIGFRPLGEEVLSVSPLQDNVLKPDALADAIRAVSASGDTKKRRGAAVILPDFCGRIAVLDFDSFPTDAGEQMSLVRFRVKKTVPFDVESAAIGFQAQALHGTKKTEVVVSVVALEILARYEAAFRSANLHPGYVTTSSLASLELVKPDGVRVVVKLTGRVLTVSVLDGKLLKLVRCVQLPSVTVKDTLDVLYPTFAYVEDEMKTKPSRILLAGFGEQTESLGPEWESELNVPSEPLHSRFGSPDQFNAGLMGYLEGAA